MGKQSKLNPLDHAIKKWAAVFNGIEGYQSKDEDVRYAGTFIATKILSLEQSRSLTINSFVPAVNKIICDTKKQLSTSIYKQAIQTALENNLQVIKEDTVRLGYVMFFHKYENFVKEYMLYVEKRNQEYTKETGQTFFDFCKLRFGFNPFSWWKYPIIHKVNFISNCTKHHDGKCKLDNPKNTKPSMYANIDESEVIKPDISQFKNDTYVIIQSISNQLVHILENAVMIRVFESLLKQYDKTITVFNEGLRFNEDSMRKTFIYEGIEYPVLTGNDLQTYIDDNVRYKTEIAEHNQKAQEYKDKITIAEQTIKSNIKLLETEAI